MAPRPPFHDGIAQASRRPLKIFASDPLQGRTFGNRAKMDVANEALKPGPIGARLEVLDYDGAQKCWYTPVDLVHPAILLRGGLDPSEADPRFYQQMVYAVAMKTVENFDRALGGILRLGSNQRKRGTSYPRLRLFPHAFYGANAYYTPDLNAILFGYFRAEADDVGPNLPGQTVFTCLPHDVIAHEMTHAIVDRLWPLFLEPSNIDVLAFDEGFADIVALFQPLLLPGHRARADPTHAPGHPISDRAGSAGPAVRLRHRRWEGAALRPRCAGDAPDRRHRRAARSGFDPGGRRVRRISSTPTSAASPTSSASPRAAQP